MALVSLARFFLSSFLPNLQAAQHVALEHTFFPTPLQARQAKRCRHTMLGPLQKQVMVYFSPWIKWNVVLIYGQINSHFSNTKRSIWVTLTEVTKGGLSLMTTTVPDKADLAVFTNLFESHKSQAQRNMEIHVEVLTSKSSFKIMDFLYFGLFLKKDAKCNPVPVSIMDLVIFLKSFPFSREFEFHKTLGPHLSGNSPSSDRGMVWFDLHDL